MADTNIIISSDCILDKDIGLLKIVEFFYRKLDIYLDNVLDDMVLEMQQYLEYTRLDKNPMVVFTYKEYWDDTIDSLYTEFLNSEKDRICEYSCSTLILNTILLMIKSNAKSRISILCESEYEQSIILKRLGGIASPKVDFIIEADWSKVDLGNYSDIYVKYVSDLDRFKTIHRKALYISNHALNMLNGDIYENVLIPDVLNYMEDNIINTFSFYNFNNIEI